MVHISDNFSRTEAIASSGRLFLYIFNEQRIAVSSSVVRCLVPILLRLDCGSIVREVLFEFSATVLVLFSSLSFVLIGHYLVPKIFLIKYIPTNILLYKSYAKSFQSFVKSETNMACIVRIFIDIVGNFKRTAITQLFL